MPGRFTSWKKAPSTHCIGGWVDPRAGLDGVEKKKFVTLPGFELRPLGCPAHSQSLYDYATPAPVYKLAPVRHVGQTYIIIIADHPLKTIGL
jgi:hypothetical protein